MSESKEGTLYLPHLKAVHERMERMNDVPLPKVEGARIQPDNRPLITLEQFFKGSASGNASLWFNAVPQYLEGQFDEQKFWKSLRDRNDVWDVLVLLSEMDLSNYPKDLAPYGDVVVVITSASPEDILKDFPHEYLQPDYTGDEWGWFSTDTVFVPTGMKPLHFWYD